MVGHRAGVSEGMKAGVQRAEGPGSGGDECWGYGGPWGYSP